MNAEAAATHPLVLAARALRPQIEAAADEIERERRIPEPLVRALIDAGLYKMLIPRSLGGSEADLLTFSHVLEQVAQADASTAWCLSQNGGISRVSAFLPREGAEEAFGAPDMALAWGNGPSTAVKVEGGYRLTGKWVFTSGIHHATWLGCQLTNVVDAEGQPLRLDDNGNPKTGIFMFPATEAEISDVWQVSGLKGTGSDTFTVTDLFVPESRCALDEPLESNPLYVFGTTNIFSCGFASVSLGMARASLDAFVDMAITKTPRGLSGPLREQQTVQVHVAQAEATLRSARAFLHQTIEEVWRGVSETGQFSVQGRIFLRLATTYAFHCACEVVDKAYYLAGSTAILNSAPFERRLRDMHAATQHIQAREDHFEPVGQFLLGLEPSLVWL
ncbi:MAG: acyl-CoA dehydrogenase [Dehalococcoidia bacterium]|nr:acyl-CoA dehydrogenase [Dehalococcoidia bacterium]